MSGILQSLFLASGSRQIEYVGAGTTATSASNSIGVPSGVQAGDLLLIVSTSGATHTLTTTTGWTNIVTDATSGSCRIQVWWKIAGASESANSVTSTQSRMRIVMFAYRNVASSPVDAAPTTANGGTSTSAATVSVTTTVANDLVIGFASTSSSASYTYPASVNQRYNVACDGTINGIVYWDELQTASGASTVRTATLSSSVVWRTYTAAFKQA